MKKYIIFLVCSLLSVVSSAQLTNAVLALENKEYRIAKESIDKYMAKEKSANDAKGWYYKAAIYYIIAFAADDNIRLLAAKPDAIKIAAESYARCIATDKPNGEWAKKAQPELDNLWGLTFNESIDQFKSNNYTASIAYMKLCSTMRPKDTTAYTTGALISIQAKEFKEAKSFYEGVIAINYKPKSVFKNLYYVVMGELKDTSEAFKVLAMARDVFPTDKEFMTEEINLYIATKKQDEAINKLNEAILNDPTNAKIYLYNLGIIYLQSKDKVKAKEYFNKSLAKDSLYEGANYMMGYMIIEEGDEINKKINNMTIKEFNLNGKKEESRRDATYKKAIPYLEKAYKVNKEEALRKQLTSLYTKFKMDAKIKDL